MSLHEGQVLDFPYVYRWGPRMPGAMARKGQRCRVLVRGKLNSALVEFEDGFLAVIIRNALRRVDGPRTRFKAQKSGAGPRRSLRPPLIGQRR